MGTRLGTSGRKTGHTAIATSGRLTIGRLVFGLVAALVVAIWGSALRDVHAQYKALREAQTLIADNLTADHLLAAGRAMIIERGQVLLCLSATAAAEAESLDRIARHRRDGAAELAAALDRLSESDELRTALKQLEALRPRIDRDLAVPLAERDPTLRQDWLNIYGDVLHEMADTVRETAMRSNRGVTVVRRLTRIRLWSLELRQAVGEESARIGGAAATGRVLAATDLMTLARLRGGTDVLLQDLRTEIESAGTLHFLAALDGVRQTLNERLRPLQDRVLGASVAGTGLTIAARDYSAAALPVLERLDILMDLAREEAAARVHDAHRAAARTMVLHSLMALAALGFGAAALVLLYRRLLAPLRALREDLRRLARGDLEIAGAGPRRHDELGQMRTTLIEFRDVLDERRALWNALPDFICFKDAEGRWQWVNAAAAALFRLEDGDYRGKDDAAVTAAAPHLAAWLQSAAGAEETVRNKGATISREEVIADAQGEVHFFQVLRVPLFHADRTCRGTVVLGRDVTDRRRTEIAMARLAQQNQLLLDCAGEGIIGLDTQGRITFVNPAVERMTGWDSVDMVGQSQHWLMHRHHADGTDYPEETCPIHQTLDDGRTRHCEREVFWCRNGTALPVEFTVTPIVEQDSVRGAVIIFRDIHARLAAEEEIDSLLADLKRSNAELERFAYVASHDLRQPLRMVTSYLSLIERRMAGRLDGDEREFLDFAIDGAQRMDRMILDLLDYSRIGRTDTMEPVPLADAVDGALAALQIAIADAGAEVTVPPSLPVVAGIRSELERLFQNLMANAIKFRTEGQVPRIAVTCAETGDEWVIAVTDNGIGIDPKDHDRLFNIFQRLVPQSQYEGTGIGLASCRKIAEHHGGRIWVRSQPGQGATFFVALPKRLPVAE